MLIRKKRLQNILLIVGYFLVYSFVWVLVYYLIGLEKLDYAKVSHGVNGILSVDIIKQQFETLKYYYFSSMGHTLLYSFYGVVTRLGIDLWDKSNQHKEQEKQHIKTELALLRSQINPHFLFNTLNNINSFAERNSDKTSFAIIKLSEIMRYMLYEAQEGKVKLDKEIQYINSFLELQKLRFSQSDFIDFKVEGDTSNVMVPPLLFIPFIENAFKHGSKKPNDQIKLNIAVNKKRLIFDCENKTRELNETEKVGPGGIGVENIQRRLALLYPKNHTLTIDKSQSHYHVHLTINNYEN